MTESDAIVVRVDGDYAWVSVQGACSACSDAGSCGLRGSKEAPLQRVRNDAGGRVGDRVVIGVPDGTVWRAALYCYLIPIVLVLTGAVSGTVIGGQFGSMLGFALGGACGWLIMRFAGRREPEALLRLKHDVIHLHRNPQT